jgi:hypothetical protein
MSKSPGKAPRKIEPFPETLDALPDVSPQEIKPESNPFTSRDWRMLVYAWMGLLVRGILVGGAIFTVVQFLDGKEETRVERTLQLVELWEREEYQDAQRAVSARLDALNTKYAGLIGSNPSAAERAVYLDQVGIEAMTEAGGEMQIAEFRAAFDRVLYFLNRMAFCVEGNLCSKDMVDGYFGDFAGSFWDYFRGFIEQQRARGETRLAAPLEAYVAKLPDRQSRADAAR